MTIEFFFYILSPLHINILFFKKMTFQLPTECLNEILEYFEEDELTLHSCLLVNRLWCKIAVRILWRNIFDFIRSYQNSSLRVKSSKILSTLIACLPNESKELLYENGISISTPTSNPPLFNYAEFCKVLSINKIILITNNALNVRKDSNLVANEIIKMLTDKISSLKKFTYNDYYYYYSNTISIPYIPGAKDLSELCCSSNLPSGFFYQLSQICHNLQSISISFDDVTSNVPNELKELISSQNNLKNLTLSAYDSSWANIIPTVIKHSQTITTLRLYGDGNNLPFSFVSLFTNLQEFIFSFIGGVDFKEFKKLQYVNFPKLEILKIPYQHPKPKYVVKFLENNGKNLKKFYTDQKNKDLNLSIASLCPNIRSLFVIFNQGEIDILKTIFISCKYLESIMVWCGDCYLNETEVLDIVVKYSPNNFHELKLYNSSGLKIYPEELELFFTSWRNRMPNKLLFLIFVGVVINEEP
jgi:hypothetical protein